MRLGPMFHWSPADRYGSILRDGLQPFKEPTVSSAVTGYVCLSPTAAAAWALSGAADWATETDAWDLWQVELDERDEVRVRPGFGPVLREVRIHNPIPADRLWWAGRRDTHLVAPCDATAPTPAVLDVTVIGHWLPIMRWRWDDEIGAGVPAPVRDWADRHWGHMEPGHALVGRFTAAGVTDLRCPTCGDGIDVRPG